MPPLRVAFVGIDNPHGSMWRTTVNMHPELAPVALVARSPEETQTLQPEFKGLPLYYAIDELLDKTEFDAAVITLSNKEAAQACITLANAGKHLIAEKTTARNAVEFQTVADAVEANGVQWTTGYLWRFSPVAGDIRRMVKDGAFGDVWAWEGRYWTSTVKSRDPGHYLFSKEESGSGMFGWLGCHSMDLMLYMLDDDVVSVTAKVGNVSGEDITVEDGGVAIFQFAGGAMASLRCGYYLATGGNQLHYGLFGSKGSAQWDPQEPVLHVGIAGDDTKERAITYEEPAMAGYGGQKGQDLLNDWLACIRNGDAPRSNVHTAMKIHRLLDAIYQSSAEGREVEM